MAVLSERGDGGSPGGEERRREADAFASRSPGGSSERDDRTEWTHDYPTEHTGPVWITVDAPDERVRAVVIRWGPFERPITHDGAEPKRYLFNKDPGESPPLTVGVEPEAHVTFEYGATPPADAEDVNAGWVEAG